MVSLGEIEQTIVENKVLYALSIVFRIALVLTFLYFFLVALAIMGDGFKAVGGKDSGSLFTSVNNPVAGLMVGILATVLVQSSSTTTSVVVSAVGAAVLPVQTGVPIIMGANIGTSVTNTIVSLGFANDHTNYERAFSGATVHDMFNFLGVLIFLPLDSIWAAASGENVGFLNLITDAMLPPATESADLETTLFIKDAVADISKAVININKDIISDYAQGRPSAEQCGTERADGTIFTFFKLAEKKACADSLLPVPSLQAALDLTYGNGEKTGTGKFSCLCDDENITELLALPQRDYTGFKSFVEKEDCSAGKFKFDYCANYTNAEFATDFGITSEQYQERVLASVQYFFDNARLVKGGDLFDAGYDDVTIGILSLIISLIMMIACLVGIVKTMQSLIAGPAEKWVVAGLNYNFPGGGYLAILIGAGITLLVQSSSITTSILTPMVAIGTLSLENMFPFTIGANLGTTGTGLISGLASGARDGIQIALCHTFFNILNTLIWYPIPFMREIPLSMARFLGKMAAAFRPFPLIYIFVAFVIYPLFFLAISVLLGDPNDGGAIAGGVILILLFVASHGLFLYWYHIVGGKHKVRKIVNDRAEANKTKTADILAGKVEDDEMKPEV